MLKKLKKSKGFTLIEMLVVIAIIAVLVSIIVPVVGNSTTKAKAAADAANLRSMASTLAVDYMDNGEINGTYTKPTSKYLTSNGEFHAYVINGNIVCTFGNHGVDYFAYIAEHGTAPGTDVSISEITSPSPTNDSNKELSFTTSTPEGGGEEEDAEDDG